MTDFVAHCLREEFVIPQDRRRPTLDLPCDDPQRWSRIEAAFAAPVQSAGTLRESIHSYIDDVKWLRSPELTGLQRALTDCGDDVTEAFFDHILPSVIKCALALPSLVPETGVTMLHQGETACLTLDRGLVCSLLANMFLCTFTREATGCAHERHMARLLVRTIPSEVAKLRMFINYFQRTCGTNLPGSIKMYRQHSERTQESWAGDATPMQPIEVAEMHASLSGSEGCLLADFANKFIGGGVLSGGSVMEEIKFSAWPELCVSMLVCPCIQRSEAVVIVGAEQFSKFTGYGGSLRYAGDSIDGLRAEDGSCLTAVAAMDALDGRGLPFTLALQLRPELMARELNKASAAFAPSDDRAKHLWRKVATGNWGCGVFGGMVELKSVLQWMACSRADRAMVYFPFEQPIGDRLASLATKLVEAGATVGMVWKGLERLGADTKLVVSLQDKRGRGIYEELLRLTLES